MSSSDFLFPHWLTRRDFLKLTSVAAAGLGLPDRVSAQESQKPVRLGSGYHTYELVAGWGPLPPGMKYGLGCGVVVDSQDRVYVHTRSNPSVMLFDREGTLLETWGEAFAESIGTTGEKFTKTAHCVYWSKEGGHEYPYFTDHPRGLVMKTDLKGKILLTIGNVTAESSTSIKHTFDNPTDVAISAHGDIYVCEGYGSQLVHRFIKEGKWIKTIGGKGTEHGKFNTCHGIWINTLKNEPEVYIADRANKRLEVYSLDLEFKRSIGDVRNPCCFYQHQGNLYIPDLASRLTIIDANDKLVAHLGDGMDPKDKDKNPATFATPHAMAVDSRGDLYVVEWLEYGRVRKFRHAPQV